MGLVEVAVNSPGGLGGTFVYEHDDASPLLLGSLVLVPFGSAEAQGIVVGRPDELPDASIRPIAGLLDSTPVVTPVQVALARWVSEHYCASLIDALTLMLPPGIAQRPQTTIALVPDVASPEFLSEPEFLTYCFVRDKRQVTLGQVRQLLAGKRLTRQTEQVLRRLIQLGLVRRDVSIRAAAIRPRVELYARLAESEGMSEATDDLLARAPRQRETYDRLVRAGPSVSVPLATLRDEGLGSNQSLTALSKRGLVILEQREVRRDPLAHRDFPRMTPPPLTRAQSQALGAISAAIEQPGYHPFLLHGVTGSGKTEVYLRTIGALLDRGKRAIVLVPEIALTPQTIQRFAGRFPGRLAVLHSRLSPGERFDEWRRIRTGQADVVIGSRSAIFAPVVNLGGIIVDEEHEWSYKQDKSPRYHARDVALKLAELGGLLLLLGSATPALETFEATKRGQIKLLEMPERVEVALKAAGLTPLTPATPTLREAPTPASNSPADLARESGASLERSHPSDVSAVAAGDPRDVSRMFPGGQAPVARGPTGLPPVEIVDLRAELKAGNRSIFSGSLKLAVESALRLREQVILFLNRRGDSTFVLCRDCGHVMRCTRCEAPYVYHSDVEDLVCHLCDAHWPVPRECPACWGDRIRYFGIGTQKLEAEARRTFPGARVMRWDRDSASARGAHEELLRRFVNHEADVLVGTQMIAKGLDLPRVTLVGVISADTSLHLPDFRAAERTFQLLTQVAGRAGRGPWGGRVIIQTYTPEHYTIQAASGHDYQAFYEKEIAFRRQQGYPPFGELARLLHVGYGQERVQRDAEQVGAQIRYILERDAVEGIEVIGPAPAFRHKIRGRYRWQIILRGRGLSAFVAQLGMPTGWQIDVDPVSTL